jgi:hypothetical protein
MHIIKILIIILSNDPNKIPINGWYIFLDIAKGGCVLSMMHQFTRLASRSRLT